MDAVLASTIDLLEDVVKLPDLQSELAFTEPRHTEPLTGLQPIDGSWRLKERVKTVSVALVLCLNVGVDPPDVVKIEPCAHLECWVDPLSEEPQKAIEYISLQLEKQYEQWHSRARYKKCLDPTVDEVKKLCNSLRRYSKQERVLFHYNGHGVPKPTQNGEIWVFNDKYTQYIPLNVYELQQWMSTPSIYVFDCSCAGSIVNSFLEFAKQHKSDYELELAHYAAYQKTLQHNQSNNISSDNQNNGTSNQVEANQNLHDTSEAIAAGDKVGPKSQTTLKEDDGGDNTSSVPAPESTIRSPPVKRPDYESCFQLAACEAHQILPMQPDLPADLFTSCLTTPIKMALRWFIQKNDSRFMPKISQNLVDKIPGSLSDRCTMLGELNWIFTSITDTIAWDVLPRDLFQRLYRQDLLVASLFRNFLLADRIMRTYDCTPVSHPKLPKTYHHPMWRAWDMVVDLCLSQLVDVLEDRAKFKSSSFFAEQLTAFEVWLELDHSANKKPDHHLLPIILQVLLSQIHRLRALDLLSRFLNLGPGAVNSALSVGIFPYVLKLLQSKGREVRPFLLSIWAKILAFDRRCQVDLVRDHNHRYFLTILSDNSYDAHYRTMAAFVMSCIVRDFRFGQELAYQASLIAHCLEQLDDPDAMLRKWLAICLGLSWDNFEDARWCGVRSCAHEKLYSLLDDPDPEVRAAAVFALGTFINSSSERTDHANTIDHSIGMKLVSTSLYDSSVLVRRELVVALQYLVLAFESQFLKLEQIAREEERKLMDAVDSSATLVGGTPPSISMAKANASGFLSPTLQINRPASKNYMRHHEATGQAQGQHHPPYYHQGINLFPISNFIPRVNSLNAIPVHYGPSSKIVSNVYHIIWRAMYTLAADPHPNVALIAQIIIDEIRACSLTCMSTESLRESKSNSSISESSSPNTGGATFSISESPPNSNATTTSNSNNTLASKRSLQGAGRMHHSNNNGDPTNLANQSSASNHHYYNHHHQNNHHNHNGNNRDSASHAPVVASPPPIPPAPTVGARAGQVSQHSTSANIDRITKSANVTINNNHKSRRYASSRDNDVSEEDSRSNISSHKPLIMTEFVDWSTKYFIEPENSYTSSCFSSSNNNNHYKSSAGGANNNSRQSTSKQDRQREWRMLKTLSYKNVCLKELMVVDPSRFSESSSNYKCQQVPNLLAVHSYDPIMIVASRDEFSVMHLDGPHVNSYYCSDSLISGSANFLSSSSSSSLIGGSAAHLHNSTSSGDHHHNNNSHHHNNQHHHNDLIGTQSNCLSNSSQITSLQLINPQYNTLVCTGSNDGSVRIWRAYDGNDFSFSPQLIMACHLMPELLNTNNRSPIFHQASSSTIGGGGGLAGLATSSSHGAPLSSGIAGLSLNHNNNNSSNIGGAPSSSMANGFHNNTSLTGIAGQQPNSNLANSSNNINANNLGMVLLWDQDQSNFYVTSDQNDVRIIRVWDANSESKVQDIPTCAEFGVSCLSSDGEHSIAAGFLDGSIRIYDTRLKKTDCRTFTFRKHSEKILGLHMFKPGEKHINLVSGDSGGEVRFWDKRAPTSVKRVDVGQKMNVMTVHPNADLFACGLRNGQGIKIYNLDGTSRPGCVIKTQDSTFFTSRHNPSVNCLAFHPLRISLVSGYSDSVISVYSSRSQS